MTTDFRPYSAAAAEEPDPTLHNGVVNGQNAMVGTAGDNSAGDNKAGGLIYRGVAYGPDAKTAIKITKPARWGWIQWFSNLSVRQKQLAGLFTSELISVVGLMGVGSLLIVAGGRSQLLNQAKSELAVSGIEYNIKIDQMGFGFRGQSDNRAIVEAAAAYARGEAIPPGSIAAVQQILENEIKARNIEYATLVGDDLRIIANANRDRRGQQFDPNGLVGTVLQNPRQVKASAIVSWDELRNEAPPLPAGFADQDALIRYTVTPVSDPASGQVVGALVSGDIVNGKDTIPKRAIAPFGNGYSALYQRNSEGKFDLATALYAGDNADLEVAKVNVPLDAPTLIDQAAAQPGQEVTRRDRIDGTTYTLAARAIEDFNGVPIAVMVRGTSETGLNTLIGNSLRIQLLIALLALAADVGIAALLGRSVMRPLKNLQQAAWRFGMGDRQARAEVYARDEVGQVAQAFNQLAANVTESEDLLRRQGQKEQHSAARANLLADLTSRIRQSLNEQTILSTSVEGLRGVLEVDRVLIYRFHPDFKGGDITAEAIGRGWKRAVGQTIADPLSPEALERYYAGRVTTMTNRQEAQLSDCHCEILEKLEVMANMVAPLLAGDELIGLLCVHQCDRPRHWTPDEIDLIQQVSLQIGYALSQARLLQQQESTATRERQITEIISLMRESLDKERIFRAAVTETRRALQADRVSVYQFDETWRGTFVAESVGQGWPAALEDKVYDPCFKEKYIEQYRQGRVQAVSNLAEAGLTECHLRQLEQYDVKANLVAPIVINDELFGLLIAHQCSGPRNWEAMEINFIRQVAIQLGFALNQVELLKQQELTAARERQINEIVSRLRESLDEERIFRAAVTETRRILSSDRVVVYQFDETWKGTFVAESVGQGWATALGNDLYDPCFKENYIEQYRQGRVQAVPNLAEAELTECHLRQLEQYNVKANLVAPILTNGELIGLLIAHQCSGPRNWDVMEINFVRQVAIQLGFALEQARLYAQAEALSEERRQKQEALQMQLVELLSEVEGASRGDLTVRADVTAGEIGTVADFFNSIVESLRQIVTKVKTSAEQVNASLGENEGAIQALAVEALRQADDVTQTLASVEAMTASIQQVASSAQQAALVANSASTTAETSGQAMDLTVQNILTLREIIGETSKKVKRLGESSQQISKAVSLINQIAMQTNLLAINAGIEAARAGEEGQGFAVVAEEVGELAARSAEATKEIERIVETIQRETAEVVDAMDQSTTEVVAGTRLVEDAKQNLGRILDVSQQIDTLVRSISEATVSQVEISESVTQLMQAIAAESTRTSQSSQNISTSLRETVDVARSLQATVGTFKTGEE
ncbi:GAF domain-containing protein [Nodosilinea sp. LEGE 06152]|uniref:GAF domain-containing protein n=1 Tax=Nodosilinea sp. LEGE 06152 TaxID=2777966 RepID=UPI001880CDF4|nr:GAF domain-containing protein [Nodosilinea sp. LEGE 06152]MBE9159453.1 GAF domain-containing protein [Nodosilinea sp. LEGE 06152]